MDIHLHTFPDTEALMFQCLELFRSIFPNIGNSDAVMLAGGRTPLEIYRRAAKEGLSTKASLFLSDERYVPSTDPQSNYGAISPFFITSCPPDGLVGQASLYSDSLCLSLNQKNTRSRLRDSTNGREASLLRGNARRKWQPCPTQNEKHFIRVQTELSIEDAAQAFHNELSQIERIPLGFLGLGTDGHTASLFNLEDAALRDERLAIPVVLQNKAAETAAVRTAAVSAALTNRISVTPTLLNRIERIIILATGAEKKEMIQTLLNHPASIPAGVALADHPNVELWTAM